MTGGVALAPIERDDFPRVAEWLSDPGINRWLVSEFRGREVNEMLVAALARNRRNRTYVVSMEGRPCGIVGFSDLDEVDRFAMIWYVLGDSEMAGRGVTTRAVRAALEVGFGELGLGSIYAWVMEENGASHRILEKCGFRRVGRLRQAVRVDGDVGDRIYYDIVSSDVRGG